MWLAAFYRTVLGVASQGDDVHQVMLGCGIDFGIAKDDALPDMPVRGEVVFIFDAGDVDAEHERLEAMDVPILQPPNTQPWGKRNMVSWIRTATRLCSACLRRQ